MTTAVWDLVDEGGSSAVPNFIMLLAVVRCGVVWLHAAAIV